MSGKIYVDEVKEILTKRRKKWIYATLIALFIFSYALFYFSGRYAIQNQPQLVEKFLGDLLEQDVFAKFKDLFEQGKFFQIFGLIFLHNFNVALLDFSLGTTFIFSLISVIGNGIISGFISGIAYYTDKASLLQVIGFFGVLVLELLASILALVEGMYLSYSIIFPRKIWKIKSRTESFKKTFRQNVKILIIVVLLLVVAAVIETFIIYSHWKIGLKPVIF